MPASRQVFPYVLCDVCWTSHCVADGERTLPVWRTLSPRATVGEWLWGSEIGIEPPPAPD